MLMLLQKTLRLQSTAPNNSQFQHILLALLHAIPTNRRNIIRILQQKLQDYAPSGDAIYLKAGGETWKRKMYGSYYSVKTTSYINQNLRNYYDLTLTVKNKYGQKQDRNNLVLRRR